MNTQSVKFVPMATIRKSGKDRHNPLHVAACRNKMNEARKTIALVTVLRDMPDLFKLSHSV